MEVIRDQNQRESWYAKNLTNKTIVIGDLMAVPEFRPGETHDLLRFQSREKISQSKVLTYLVKAGKMSLVRKLVGTVQTPTVKAATVDRAITPAQKDAAGGTGPPGPPGADGSVWYNGSGVPGVGIGVDGDYYLNDDNGDVYEKSLGAWVNVGNIMGPAGPAGANGAPGADGSVWYNGAGAPAVGLGVNGDYYLNDSNGDVYTKAAGVWGIVGNIAGPLVEVFPFPEQGADPAAVANTGSLYTKDSGGVTELYYIDNNGTVMKLTNSGGINALQNVVEDTTPQLGGDLELNNHNIVISNPPTNDTGNGIIVSFTADANLTKFNACYLKSTGKMAKANATAIATGGCIGIALANILQDASGSFLIHGVISNTTWTWTIGGIIYLDASDGGMTQTAPSSTDNVIQVLGVALSATLMYFNPQLVQIEHL